MTPYEFILKWQGSTLNERQSYQAHFSDLCVLAGVDAPTPATADSYCFERGVTKTGSRHGWADVWKRGFFAIEYKAPERNLDAALKQLMTYALALDNPPLLVVCDTQIIQIHTHFTNAPSEVHTILLQDIGLPANLDKLRWLFTDPDKFHPQRTIAQITELAAGKFAELAQSLNGRGAALQQAGTEYSRKVAHFLNQCLFCLFAEDAGLLPAKMFERLLDKSQHEPAKLSTRLSALFASMQNGGDFGADDIAWFNGGLFATVEVLPLVDNEIASLHAAAKLDWSDIEPSIFGTLFERGLDPKKRAQLGAHYTDQHSILRIIHPVIVEPLAVEWEAAKVVISDNMALYEKGGKGSKNALPLAQGAFIGFLERLKNFRVLDPACGSGNFLYLALRALKDLEHKANLEAEMLGLQRQISIEVSPANVLGIEINPYAAELARVTVWIGEIQWMLKNGYPIRKDPILQSLEHIENRDAILECCDTSLEQNMECCDTSQPGATEVAHSKTAHSKTAHSKEAHWPAVDVIVGNPPFLGGSKMRGELGDDYTVALRRCYEGRVPGGADLVTYWFEKARAQIAAGLCQRAGLVSTQSIRKGSNQQVLARILHSPLPLAGKGVRVINIFNAWSDEPWINEGAAVRVSLVCFGMPTHVAWVSPQGVTRQPSVELATSVGLRDKAANPTYEFMLNGQTVSAIHADLTAGGGVNLTLAKPLQANAGVAFKGAEKNGAFDISGELARQWLKQPNPNGRPNSDVLRPWANGMDIVGRSSDTWIIDFGTDTSEVDAALYETPFQYLSENVKPEREKNNDPSRKKHWWRFGRTGADMRNGVAKLSRFIVTCRVAKYRTFAWCDSSVSPDSRLFVIAREDEMTFGILSSRIHEVWSLATASMHGVGNDPTYNAKSCFETFPFPEGLTPTDTAHLTRPVGHPLPQAGEGVGVRGIGIAAAAQTLNTLRCNWLNPPEWTDWQRTAEEEKAGYPLRPVSKPEHEAALKKRTLTNLYNARPAWLDNAHKTLDAAVARAYGWADYTPDMQDDEILRRLLALNLAHLSSQ